MDLFHTTKYEVKHPRLKHLIKFFWIIRSDHQITINHKLLPVRNIDFVLNLSSPIKYISDKKVEIVPKTFHFNGIRDKSYIIKQVGTLDILGISFFPAGLYPFLKIPLSEFTNKTIDLDLLLNEFTSTIEEKLSLSSSIPEKITIIENELVQLIDFKYLLPDETSRILGTFYSNIDNMNVFHFCDQYGVNQRKLERIFNKYVGISPKLFDRLNRFQRVLNQITKNKYTDLTSLAYENDYYDQTHFLKDFKSFTGCSPSQFLNEKRSVKQIL